MSEVNLRVASFIKAFSMFTVMGSLLYMYAYSPENGTIINTSQDWMINLPKAYIFYIGLSTFAIFNLVMNVGINMYKNTRGVDARSILFRNKEQKKLLHMWLTYFLAGINFIITSMVLYVALIIINEVADTSRYIFIPVVGLTILLVSVVGLIHAIIKK